VVLALPPPPPPPQHWTIAVAALAGATHVDVPVAVTAYVPANEVVTVTTPPADKGASTFTLRVNTLPWQLPDVAVTVYVAVAAEEVVLVRLSRIALPEPAPELPENPEPDGALHE